MRKKGEIPNAGVSAKGRTGRQCADGFTISDIPWIALVGRNSFLRTETPSPLHRHEGSIEIVYCQHGTCEYESRGERYRLTPGCLFVSRPSETHRMMSNPKGLATYYLLIKIPKRTATGKWASEIEFLVRKLRNVPRLFVGGPRMGSYFVRLFRYLERPFGEKAERRLRVLNTCFTLLLSVIDAARTPAANSGSGKLRALAEEMSEHPERDYPIDMLTMRTGYSSTSLILGFKTTTGYTPHAFLVKCRIERAKTRLAEGTRITSVASELGFPTSQHFANQFRNATGMTPTQWCSAVRADGRCAQKKCRNKTLVNFGRT